MVAAATIKKEIITGARSSAGTDIENSCSYSSGYDEDDDDIVNTLTTLSSSCMSSNDDGKKKRSKSGDSMIYTGLALLTTATLLYLTYKLYTKCNALSREVQQLKNDVDVQGGLNEADVNEIARQQLHRLLEQPAVAAVPPPVVQQQPQQQVPPPPTPDVVVQQQPLPDVVVQQQPQQPLPDVEQPSGARFQSMSMPPPPPAPAAAEAAETIVVPPPSSGEFESMPEDEIEEALSMPPLVGFETLTLSTSNEALSTIEQTGNDVIELPPLAAAAAPKTTATKAPRSKKASTPK